MKRVIACIFFLCIAASLMTGRSRQDMASDDLVSAKSRKALRIVAYNVGVFSKYTEDSMPETVRLMSDLDADAIALCELDSCNRRHTAFQMKDFCDMMGSGWDFRFGAAMQWNGGSYGIGAMTLSPILESFEIKIPKGGGHEPRVCVVVETKAYVLAAVHLDHKNEDVRTEQARVVTDELKSRYGRSRKPVFLCGDFNALPDSPTLGRLSEDWKVLSEMSPTYPAVSPTKCIDYIMALKNRARYRVTGNGVCTEFESVDIRSTSDHLPVFVDVKIR